MQAERAKEAVERLEDIVSSVEARLLDPVTRLSDRDSLMELRVETLREIEVVRDMWATPSATVGQINSGAATYCDALVDERAND